MQTQFICVFLPHSIIIRMWLSQARRWGTKSTIDFIQGRKVYTERTNPVHGYRFPEKLLCGIFCAHGHFASDCIWSNIILCIPVGKSLGRTQTTIVTLSLYLFASKHLCFQLNKNFIEWFGLVISAAKMIYMLQKRYRKQWAGEIISTEVEMKMWVYRF